jgi:hypothetical protein
VTAAAALDARLLAIYLRDHFAGSTGGLELARRMAANNRDTQFGPEMASLAQEIAEDRAALRDVMRRHGVAPDPLKPAIAWATEKLGRLKLNGRVTGYSPLSRVAEIEALIAGVNAKLCLWRNLLDVEDADTRVDAAEMTRLSHRAEAQVDRLHRLRAGAARKAFVAG